MTSVAARRAGLGVLAAGAGLTAWSLVEAAAYRVRRLDLAVLAPGTPAIRLLHLSDLHLAPWQRRKRAWLRGLAALEPDLTVITGDLMGDMRAVPIVVDALGDLLDRPGAFVLGSNDYFAPRLSNPLRYLAGPSGPSDDGRSRRLPTADLISALSARGWVHLDNARGSLRAAAAVIDLVGVDDPHHGFDRMPAPAEREPGAVVRLGVAHAPYTRVLDAMTDDGADVILAGHTHGGQVCVPGWGALVTNCDLPTRYARGAFAWSTAAADPLGTPARSWVHVSPGVGTSPYTPVRVACPPEAALLRLTATVVPLS